MVCHICYETLMRKIIAMLTWLVVPRSQDMVDTFEYRDADKCPLLDALQQFSRLWDMFQAVSAGNRINRRLVGVNITA